MTISDIEVLKLRTFMEDRIPDLQVVYKDEKGWQWTNFYTFIAWVFFCGVGGTEWAIRKLVWPLGFWSVIGQWRETRTMRTRFNQNFSNGLNGNTLVFPSRKGYTTTEGHVVRAYSDWSDYATYEIVRHELVHLLDQRKHPIWFPISYALILPTIFTMRAHWELRGYTATMLVRHEQQGLISERLLHSLEDTFTGPMYFWMCPSADLMRKKLVNIQERIYSGEINGFYF